MSGPSAGQIVGVLLAAGRSSRMGQSKQLLPWPPDAQAGGGTVVSAAYDAIAPHCDQMIVVLGAEASLVESALLPRRFRTIHADPNAQMFESIKRGIRAAQSVPEVTMAVIHPADHPAIRSQTVRMLLNHFESRPDLAIMPVFEGRGGHPVLVPASLFEPICNFEQPGGLRQFWRDRPETCARICVADQEVARDLDEPQDYRTAAVESM